MKKSVILCVVIQLLSGGVRTFAAKPALGIAPVGEGRVAVHLWGDTGVVHTVQSGTNLVDWTPILSVRPDNTNLISFTDYSGGNTYPRYYRAVDYPGVTDTNAPQWSGGINTSFKVSGDNVDMSWDAADDDLGITAYRIYVDGVLHNTVQATIHSLRVSGIDFVRHHNIRIEAVDASGNVSDTETLLYLPGSTILAVSDDYGHIYVSAWQTNGTFEALHEIRDIGPGARGITIADFDRDDIVDIITGYASGNSIYPLYLKSCGDGSFEAPRALTPLNGRYWPAGVMAADFDCDGFMDFIMGSSSEYLGFYWGRGTAVLIWLKKSIPGMGVTPTAVT